MSDLAKLLLGIRKAEADVLVQENEMLRRLLAHEIDEVDAAWSAMQREQDEAAA
jgi:hypothetical protein